MEKMRSNLKIILTMLFLLINTLILTDASHSKERRETLIERKKIKDAKVSIMTRYTYFPLKDISKKSAITRYDKNGNKTESFEYDNEGNIIKNITYKYNEKGLETEYAEYDATDIMLSRHENKYDKKDNIIEEIFYGKANEINYIRVCKYDPQENMVENIMYDKNKKNIGTWKYKYDAKGNKSEVEVYNAAGQYTGKYSYIYNDKDDMLEMYTYDKNGKISGRNSYRYDQKRLLTENITYNAKGDASAWKKFEYDFYRDEKTPQASAPSITTVKTTASVSLVKQPVLNNSDAKPVETATNNQQELPNAEPEPPKNDSYNPPPDTKMSFSDINALLPGIKPENLKALLYNNGCTFDTQDDNGETILMFYAGTGNEKMVKYLIENGASTTIKDKGDWDALKYARLGCIKNPKVIQLLDKNRK